MIDKLTDDNFILFCASNYLKNQFSSTEEFIEDMNRIKYIRKLITRYTEGGELKERLILNHIIILNNCFGPANLCRILYLKFKDQIKYIKPFLVLLQVLPLTIKNVGEENVIYTDIIQMDLKIVEKLRKI